MIDTNAILLCDTYKACHVSMYPAGLTKLVSYWVPRKSYFENEENQKMVWFGMQAFIKTFMIDFFEKNFFKKSERYVRKTFTKYMNIQLGEGAYDVEHVLALHRLGYLPLLVKALPEGSLVNMGIPCIELTNTHKDFAWVVQWIECILQAELWKSCNDATIGYMYARLAQYWYNKNVDSNIDPKSAYSNFDMRGDDNIESAVKTAAAWLLSSNKTSTVCALPYIDEYYMADCSFNHIGLGGISTEHSVISSNQAMGIDEEAFLKKMLTEIYPNHSFSFLGDTYDYWHFVNEIIPNCKKEILAHNGKLLLRPDSGDQCECVVGAIQKFWDIFGGTINSKGYKVLDPHIGVVLGDGCTLKNVQKILKTLDSKGFAANNVIFGIGAFCFKAIFENDRILVNTRDLFGVAMKSTYGIIDGKELKIFKCPKTDTALKKSHKGLVHVEKLPEGGFKYTDDMLSDEYDKYTANHKSAMRVVFYNGQQYSVETFSEIRNRLANEK